jgi:hypothetical protein
VLATALSGCVTGHVLEAGRRWERPATFEAGSVDGDRLVVRYVAQVSDDAGTQIGVRRRRAEVALPAASGPVPAAEDVRVAFVPDEGPLPGAPARLAIRDVAGGGPPLLVVGDDARPPAQLPANAFTTSRVALWVYPLVPLGLVVDAPIVPLLLFFAPAPIVIGD